MSRIAERFRAHTDASVGGRATAVAEVGEVGEPMFAGPLELLTAPAEPTGEATTTPEANESVARYGATRLDSQSFCARVTAPRASGVVLPAGFTFRMTITAVARRGSPPTSRCRTGWTWSSSTASPPEGRLPALPGDFAHIGAGVTWTYDVRLTTTLLPGRGRTMRFAESPTGRGWIVTFAELGDNGEPLDAGEVHTF